MIEGFVNATIGLLISWVAVLVLRASGAWEAWPALAVSVVFFGLSWARSWALRAFFRRFA